MLLLLLLKKLIYRSLKLPYDHMVLSGPCYNSITTSTRIIEPLTPQGTDKTVQRYNPLYVYLGSPDISRQQGV